MQNVVLRAFPPFVALVDEDYLLADLQHEFMSWVLIMVVMLYSSVMSRMRLSITIDVSGRVGLVAEEVARVEHDGAGYGHAFDLPPLSSEG